MEHELSPVIDLHYGTCTDVLADVLVNAHCGVIVPYTFTKHHGRSKLTGLTHCMVGVKDEILFFI